MEALETDDGKGGLEACDRGPGTLEAGASAQKPWGSKVEEPWKSTMEPGESTKKHPWRRRRKQELQTQMVEKPVAEACSPADTGGGSVRRREKVLRGRRAGDPGVLDAGLVEMERRYFAAG
ncbi:hypothetical protein CRENBAI_016313 [Crenichthys baileyi]|uniref:Uncharacterized protein n=1 Tax=Crenichthys baileyi TaxID=28760 RepID=A0AAV9RTW9_9TELE